MPPKSEAKRAYTLLSLDLSKIETCSGFRVYIQITPDENLFPIVDSFFIGVLPKQLCY
jgi:hypothetical protein